ncbi:MAG: glycosyltransferase family 4 protein [Vicinamibacteria bacterium]|nr:glycosyltransferase family 4 protein [Vicinamibacteria bacterium]
MKILMVTSSYPLFEGDGTAPFIEGFARSVAARGHQVDVVLPAHPRLNRAEENGLRFFPFPYTPVKALGVWGYAQSMNADRGFKWKTLLVAPFAALATARAVRHRLAVEAYDVVHAHWVIPGGVLSLGPAMKASKPLVISLHGSDVFAAERSAAVGFLARRAFRAAGAVTACSSDLRERALRLGSGAEGTRTVPYGVDAKFFRAEPPMSSERTASMRLRLGASMAQTLVVAIGRLVEKKGFSCLVEALSEAPELHLALVGDGDLQADLRSLALASRSSVTLAGRFSRTEIKEALECADLVAVPSVVDTRGNVDGLPNTLLEAMAAGKAIVASRVAGIPDVVTHGVEGVLVPPKSPPALREALLGLACKPLRRAELGVAASLRVQRDLTWDRVAAIIEECYVQASALAKH